MDALLLPRPGAAAPAATELPASLARALTACDGLGVVICDRAFRYLLWNRFMEALTGLPAAAVLGRDALEIHPHLREERLEAVLRRVLAGETVSLPDRRFTVPGVRSGWIWVQYHPHRGADGRVAGVVGLVHDVTERVRAEEETQRLAAFLRATPTPALECDASGRVAYANPAALRLVERMRLGAPAALLPAGSPDLVRGALAGASGVHGVEVELGDRLLAWSFHPHAPLGLVHCLAEDVTERRRVEARLRRDALHDALTGLPNRRHFGERLAAELARARRSGGPGPAVCLLDLDRFKLVNDALGHGVGDTLISAAAERLRGALPPSAFLARWEGDEFAVLLSDVSADAARAGAAVLQRALDAPLVVNGHEFQVSATAGVAAAGGAPILADALLRGADTALHHAKGEGTGGCACFDAPMHAAVVARLEMATGLRRALERGEITPFFQPVIALDTGRIVGAEALARWRHPERGWLPPADFVAAAEEGDSIASLGRRVLEAACTAAAGWPPPVAVSVNLSVRQLRRREFVSEVGAALAATGLAPTRLRLEVTESVLAADPAAAAAALDAIRALGVGVWMDDFGTGYSSLATLHRLPVDGLKLDRSSIAAMGADPRARDVVRAIIGLASALGLAVVAEGVEEPGQLAELRRDGCGLAQGFLFSPPLSPEAFARLLAGGPRW
jgi:diguanylate cyclase (GGDEF)-like protein/PAS domain S-box-containing protein